MVRRRSNHLPARKTRIALILLAALVFAAAPVWSLDQAQQRSLAVAESLWTGGQVDDCRRWLAQEISAASSKGDDGYRCELLALRGQVNARVGHPAEAETDLRQAVDLADATGRPAVARRSLRWLGFALLRQGRDDEALRLWGLLVERSRRAGDDEHEGWAWAGIAFHSWRTGQARRSIAEYQRAESLFLAQGDLRGRAYVLNGLGTAWQSAGEYDDAVVFYEQAAVLARDLDWSWLEDIARNNIAAALYITGDPGRARAAFLESYERHLATGDVGEAAVAGANVARCDAALGLFDEAARGLETIRAECRRRGVSQVDGSLANTLAEICRQQGRDHAAASLFRETAAAGRGTPAKARLEGLIGLSRTLAELDSVEAARVELRRHRAWVESLEDPRLRTEYLVELGKQSLASGHPDTALALLAECASTCEAHEWRALRIDALSSAARAARQMEQPERAATMLCLARDLWEAERGLPADPEWRESRAELADDIRQQLGSLLVEHPQGASLITRTRDAFDAVQLFKARTLIERMSGPSGIEAPVHAVIPVTCLRLQREVLRPGELLLDFYLGRDESFVFAVNREECRAVPLATTRRLDDPLRQYIRIVSSPPRSDAPPVSGENLERTGEEIRSLLLGPVEEMIGASRTLIVVPDGLLHRLSFAALLAHPLPPAGRAASTRSAPTVQIAPSATIFAQLRQSPDGAVPANGLSCSVLTVRGATDSLGRLLWGARREVRDLERGFRGVRTAPRTTLVAARAHADDMDGAHSVAGAGAVRLGSTGCSILHIAAHATIEEERPWRSSIRIDGEPGAGRSDVITAADIVRSHLDVRLAVLSSCRTAGGRLVSGEGVQGLAGAFLVAGVPTVVATLWPVDDAAAPYFMRRFYAGLAEGSAVAEALARAQEELRRDRRFDDPYHWAAYTVLGDGSRIVRLKRRPWPARTAISVGLIVLGALALGGGPLLRFLRRCV